MSPAKKHQPNKKDYKKKKSQSEVAEVLKPVTEANIEEHKNEIFDNARRLVKPLAPSRHKGIYLTGLVVAIAAVAFVGSMAYAIYGRNSDNALVYQVSRYLPFPAAKVGSRYVSYGDYLFYLRPLKHYYSNPPEAAGAEPVDFTTPEGQEQLAEIQQTALAEAERNAMMYQLANAYGVEVTEEEVDARVVEDISREGGEEKFADVIQSYYNWTIDDYKKALEAQLLMQKLQPALSDDQRDTAEDLLARIEGGEDFAAIAKEFSEDAGSAQNGGNLGESARGTYVTEFEDAAYALEPGEVSDIVESPLGFHIIRLEAKNGDAITASHILIRFANVDAEIQQELANTDIVVYVDELKPIEAQELPDELPGGEGSDTSEAQ